MKYFIACLYIPFLMMAGPCSINFSIPECKIVREIAQKDLDFAPLIPGDKSTYIYNDEASYYKDYQRSYYAITCKKAGWDCMRHYEILANGCIPYFVGLDACEKETMYFLPRELIKEAMELEGVSYRHIDHSKFNKERYYEILNKLLAYTREHLTTKAMAQHVLKTVQYKGTGKILFLSPSLYSDYMRCLTLIGLKELYPSTVVDFPKIPHIYTSSTVDLNALWGKGMSYSKIIHDIYNVDRENIEERIKTREFDLVIYGSVHRGMPYLELVQSTYSPEQIVYICGEDIHKCPYTHLTNFFLREHSSSLSLGR